MKTIKIASGALMILFILLSSCVIVRKKKIEKLLENVDPDPKTYCFTVKTKITDILSVKAKIDNQLTDQNFMFDTGAPLTYSFKTKDSFNIAAKKLFRLGVYKFDYGSGTVNFGNVKFNNVGFLVTDYVMEEYKEVEGLIGASMLQTSICEINFADSTIKVSNDLKNFTNIQNSYSGTFEPSESQATPIVKIAIGKDTTTAFIDTGFDGILKLSQKEKIPLEAAEKQESFWNSKYFGEQNKDLIIYRAFYRVHRMGVLGMALDSIVIRQYPGYYGRNLIGLAFLKKFIVTIDWIHHRIYLKPIEEVHFTQNIYTYGFTCWMQDQQLRVLEIYKGSEFEKAGIKSGDVIVSINKTNDFSDVMISNINANKPGTDSIQIEIKNKPAFTLTKHKLFN